MIYVKFIIPVITVSNKWGGVGFFLLALYPEVLPHEPTVFCALV